MNSLALNDENMLYSAVGRPQTYLAGRPAYRGLARKAAALFYSLAGNHAFRDGNKRTAVLATQQFFVINNVIVPFTDTQWINLAYLVADRRGRPPEDLLNQIEATFKTGMIPFASIPKTQEYASLRHDLKVRASAIRSLQNYDVQTLEVSFLRVLHQTFGEDVQRAGEDVTD